MTVFSEEIKVANREHYKLSHFDIDMEDTSALLSLHVYR